MLTRHKRASSRSDRWPRKGPLWQARERREPWQRVQLGLSTVALVVIGGCVGYKLLGLSWFDALYQTVVTVTTVGFGETSLEDAANQTAYRSFSLVLMVVGTGSVLYTLGLFADNLIEGNLNEELRRRRMLRSISELDNHTIIAGWGQVGHSVADYVQRAGGDVIVVDRDPGIDESTFPVVRGEATEDSVLLAAGIERAKTLIVALDHDADTLFVCLSARALCSDLFIVARVNDQKNEPKLYQAGADRVINPHEIGGSRMAALALQPHLAEFLDEIMHDDRHGVRLEEVAVPAGSSASGRTIIDLQQRSPSRSLVIAIRHVNGHYTANPDPATSVAGGDILVALGSVDQLAGLRSTVERLSAT